MLFFVQFLFTSYIFHSFLISSTFGMLQGHVMCVTHGASICFGGLEGDVEIFCKNSAEFIPRDWCTLFTTAIVLINSETGFNGVLHAHVHTSGVVFSAIMAFITW